MLQMTVQTIVIILISFGLGALLGGWLIGMRRNETIRQLQLDLTGIKVNFQNAREDAHNLRSQLRTTEERSTRLLKTLEVTSGHKKFSTVRGKLEAARREIQLLKAELNRREQLVFDLRDVIHTLSKHLKIRQQPRPKKADNILKLPVVEQGADDLKLIDGISEKIAHQLHSLGIVSYRQIAECGPKQLANIQRLIGDKQSLPLREWVLTARKLFQQKYGDGDVCANISHTA